MGAWCRRNCSGFTPRTDGGRGAETLLDAANGWVATTNGELAGKTGVATRVAGAATNCGEPTDFSPAAAAGAASSNIPSTARTALRITLVSTRTAGDLFALTIEFCPGRRPTSIRPTGRSRHPTDGSHRRPLARGARGLRVGWARTGRRSRHRGAWPAGSAPR